MQDLGSIMDMNLENTDVLELLHDFRNGEREFERGTIAMEIDMMPEGQPEKTKQSKPAGPMNQGQRRVTIPRKHNSARNKPI